MIVSRGRDLTYLQQGCDFHPTLQLLPWPRKIFPDNKNSIFSFDFHEILETIEVCGQPALELVSYLTITYA